MDWQGDTTFTEKAEPAAGIDASIELVGTYLRLSGHIPLGRFRRLTDLINASSGYVHIHDAQLLRATGEPDGLVLPDIMVDQDEISFIAETGAANRPAGAPTRSYDQPFANAENRVAREYVMFTPAHTITGTVYLFGQTDLRGFVDATDPRFLAVTDATTRSLANRRVVNRYPFLIVNRTQMIAASAIGQQTDAIDEALAEH
jgi:hypothetical protein